MSVGRTAVRLSALLLLVGVHASLANPYIEDLVGWLSTGSHAVAVDSATVLDCGGGFMFYLTTGWGGDTGIVDTFDFQPEPEFPPMGITLFLTQDDSALLFSTPNIVPDTWYTIPGAPRQAEVLFATLASMEEDRGPLLGRARLAVSPSIVTGQMTLRLQPVGTGRSVVEIHDAVGNVIRSLDCTAGTDGVATATWNREDESGRLVPEGVYFCRYAVADVIAVRKVLVAH